MTGFSLSLTDAVTLADAINLLGLPPLVTRFTYGLSDLAALFATIGADGVPTDLALATDAIFGSDLTFGGASSTPEDLQVSSLAPGDAMTTDGAGLAGLAGARLAPPPRQVARLVIGWRCRCAERVHSVVRSWCASRAGMVHSERHV